MRLHCRGVVDVCLLNYNQVCPYWVLSDMGLVWQTNLQKELVLFVRRDQETGFYYFGGCKDSHEYNSPNYPFPHSYLEFWDTKFSDVNVSRFLNYLIDLYSRIKINDLTKKTWKTRSQVAGSRFERLTSGL